MRSSGGVATVEEAAAHPALILLSGPAGGRRRARARSPRSRGVENAIAFDMGGTSTDVCLIAGGRAERSRRVVTSAGLPIRLPMVDVHTVGAGGGSIAWRDAGGALRVGPRSAGAAPGPACYGRGGTRADRDRRQPAARPAAARSSPGGLELDRRPPQRALAGFDPRRVVDGRQRRDAARAAGRLGRARPRPARLRARRLRRRRPAARLRARRRARLRESARARRGGRALGARARRERRAPRPRPVVRASRWRRSGDLPARARRACATAGSRSSSRCRSGRRARRRASTAHTRSATATRTAAREVELVAVRTADVAPGRRSSSPAAGPSQVAPGPRARRAARRDLLGPADGWAGETDAHGTLVLERVPHRSHVELQVIGSSLRAIAEEMGAVLVRSAFSSNIKERRDCSTALFDRAGRMIVQAEHIPVHLGAMPEAVAAVMARDPAPDDVWVLNDPYTGGTHLPDITLVSRPSSASPSAARTMRTSAAWSPRACRRSRGALPGRARHPAHAPRRRRRWTLHRRELAQPGRAARRPAGPARCAPPRRAAQSRSSSRAAGASASRRAMDELYAYSERVVRAGIARASRRPLRGRGRRSRPSRATSTSASRSRSPATRSRSTSPARRPSTGESQLPARRDSLGVLLRRPLP